MLKILIFVIFCTSCSSLPKNTNEPTQPASSDSKATLLSRQISDKEQAQIFAAFDYINKQVWARVNVPVSIEEYRMTLKRVPEGTKKQDVEDFLNKMDFFICPLTGNFVTCGYIKDSYSFCDDARIKLNKNRYKDYSGQEDKRKQLSLELGCR